MSVYATNMFSTQPGRARDLIDTLTRVLPDTLKHGGCELIQILHDQDDPNSVLAITRWTTREHYEDYLSWRDGTGDTAMFRTMLTEPMKVAYYDTAFTTQVEPNEPRS
jgi:heme-degrading monooxygenase HmoA